MSFKRLEADDFVVSADSITAGLFTDSQVPQVTTLFTSSNQANASSGDYYLNVFSNAATSSLEFAVTYGNKDGSGSVAYDIAVDGKSPSSTIYGQYRTLVLGDENANFTFGGVVNETSQSFWAISIDRNRYKESILPGSTTLVLSSSAANGGVISLTDNSQVVSSVVFNDAGRVFQLVSGSAGTVFTGRNNEGYSTDSGSYGLFLPDIATYILNPQALRNDFADGGISLDEDTTSALTITTNPNPNILFVAMSSASVGTERTASFTANSEETITSDFVFVRPRSSEFNYSENPSFISGSTGEVLYPSFINSPTTYITTVGLYNDTNELLAVAKLSRPLEKDFTKEALVRVKLDF
jgi:hypothetical protein